MHCNIVDLSFSKVGMKYDDCRAKKKVLIIYITDCTFNFYVAHTYKHILLFFCAGQAAQSKNWKFKWNKWSLQTKLDEK